MPSITLLYRESGFILGMRPANERWRYTETPSLTGWVHTQNDPWWNTDIQINIVQNDAKYLVEDESAEIK